MADLAGGDLNLADLVPVGTVLVDNECFIDCSPFGCCACSQIPLGRLIEPREVADAVVSLAFDELGAVTGADLNVSGGMVMY